MSGLFGDRNVDGINWARYVNPADAWKIHFVGEKDRVIGPEIAESYRARFPAAQQPEVVAVPGFDHRCCWARDWPVLLPKERH